MNSVNYQEPADVKCGKIVTFRDFLAEKAKIVRKYEFWCERHPQEAAAYRSKMRDEIAKLLDLFEGQEAEHFRKVREAAAYGGSVKRKLIPHKKGD